MSAFLVHLTGLTLLLAAAVSAVSLLTMAVFLAPRRRRRSRVLFSRLAGQRRRAAYRQKHGREGAKSADISARQERAVKAADRNRCVARRLGGCAGEPRGRWFYEIDHGIPWIAGGITWRPNLFLLCFFHNQTKCNYNVDKDGFVHYRPSSYGGVNDVRMAAAILAAERRARRSPLRWLLLMLG